MKRPAKKHTYDDTLLVTVLILVLVGLILLTSTSAYNGRVKFHDSYYYLKKQGLATVLGMAGMLWIARIDYHRWIPLAVPGYLAAIGLSIAVMAFGKEYNGSKASFRTLSEVLIFVASPRYAQFIWMAVSGVGFLGIFLALESYRLERLAIWRNPEKYEKGYQTLQGLYAIGSGGLFGRGLGNSVQKLGFLPEAQNDMIFSIVCEELGLVGAGAIIVLFLILIWRFFVIATHAPDLFGALIAAGAMAHMMIQVILNIAVVTNSIPNTGITLPFISYGGTSVVFLLLEMGLVLSISRLVQ